jgi:hypothetical protein
MKKKGKKTIKQYLPAFLPLFTSSGSLSNLRFAIVAILNIFFVVTSSFAVTGGFALFGRHVWIGFPTFACGHIGFGGTSRTGRHCG